MDLRPPYFAIGGLPDFGAGEPRDYVFRSLSSRRAAIIGGALNREDVGTLLAAIAGAGATPGSMDQIAAVVRAVQHVRGLLELLGAAIGYAWTDEAAPLGVERPTTDSPAALRQYGGDVLEALHEHGWTGSHQLGVGMALLDQVLEQWTLEAKVRERAMLFVARTVTTASPSDSSSGGTSTADSAPSES